MRYKLMLTLMVAALSACSSQTNEPEEAEMADAVDIRELWDFSDALRSRERFLDSINETSDNVLRAELRTQVAQTHSLRAEFGQAHAILDEVEAGPAADHPRVRTRVLLERGRTFNSNGEPERALPLFEEAVSVARNAGEEFLAGDAMHMAAIVSDLEAEEGWVYQLRDYVVVGAEGARYWRAPMHNNLGWTYFFAERYDDAIAQFRFSRDAYARQPDKRMETILASYGEGRSLRMQGSNREALVMLQDAYDAIEQEYGVRDEFLAEEIALCHDALGNAEGAQRYAQIAFEAFSQQQWFVTGEAERFARLRELSGN